MTVTITKRIIELFQERARELLSDKDFLGDPHMFSCQEMTNAAYEANRSVSLLVHNRTLSVLQDEFKRKLIDDSMSMIGYEISKYAINHLSTASAFVHIVCCDDEGYIPNGEYDGRFVATRKAWLNFVLDYKL